MSTPVTLETTIEAAAKKIYQQLDEGVPPEIHSEVDEWCELQGLDRLDEPLVVVARQAAFNVLLKATIYEQYHQCDRLPELDSNLREAFQTAEETTDDPAFGEYVLDEVAWTVERTELADLVEARYRLIAVDEPAEEIGGLFESLTPQESRRKLGQFRTPTAIADLMAAWITPTGDEQVLDPGMGAGALSTATYRQKRSKSDSVTLDEIHGADLNELALVMGATSLHLLDPGGPHNLRAGDFLNLTPDDLDREVDGVISNPPYTRHHELSGEYKTQINSQVEAELGRDVSALSTMYAYFYYHAAKFLKPDGRASFITPSEFLETGYGESLKQYLIDEYDIKALVLFDRDESSVFDEAMTTSLVSFLERESDGGSDELTRFIRVDDYPGKEVLSNAITDSIEGKTEWGFVNVVQQDQLEAEDKWTELFDPLDIETGQLTPLTELATVNRGIATGANSYFCLTQEDVEEWELEEEYLSPLIRNSRSVPYLDYQEEDWNRQRKEGDEVWLLYHLEDLDWDWTEYQKQRETEGNARLSEYTGDTSVEENPNPHSNPNVVEYLKYGVSDDVQADDSYLAQNRNPWYVVDRRDPAPILVTYMSRGGCRFILNETCARSLNNLHAIYEDVNLEDSELKALLAYLNSGFADEVVRRSGRTYSTGMDKIEPNELETVPVLDPRELDPETVTDLAQLFDHLRESARSGESDPESVVAEIDAYLEQILR
ncbi:HsdM family class I SAM-dependent methyltransferase [Halorussus pelagicus]|uniref:HsdM family class I SAM-dependent methyltransferase n=1 Tax=Halorussus pelagicus TaxID=2505977 RepID=UPI000FFB37E8|nr:N-6 DNA methylase [Halorussus pelagicus]